MSGQQTELLDAPSAMVEPTKEKRTISFFVSGEPKPQPRSRSFVLRGKGGKPIMSKTGQPIIRVHEAGTAENWKSQIALAAKDHTPFPPFTGPLRMTVRFRFPRLKAHYRSNGQLKDKAPQWHISRGDVDNLWKGTADALTVLGMWDDDSQVCDCHITKAYSEVPGADITIAEI